MSEPIKDFTDVPNEPRRRGRPRSPATIARDERVLAALRAGGRSREQLVEELDLRPQLVYLSLWRLRREGKVERTSDANTRHLWQLVA